MAWGLLERESGFSEEKMRESQLLGHRNGEALEEEVRKKVLKLVK
jgi:hypothetical protein